MPNPWTGKGNPYTRKEVVERLRAQLKKGRPIIAAGAGTGISAKFIEKGGADLIIIYNSGRFRMAGRGSTCGLMAYGDANAIAMEIGEHEVLPVVEEIPVICGVHASDPRRRMWHWLLQVKAMGFSGVNNFPTHCIVDGQFRQVLEETGMSVRQEFEMVALARKMDLFSIVYVATAEESKAMAEAGADAIIAHVGTTVGGSIGVKGASVTMPDAVKRVRRIIESARPVRKDIIFLCHGGPIATPEDAAYINERTDAVGFVGPHFHGQPPRVPVSCIPLMLFLFRKNWSFRTTSTAVAALVVLSTLRSFAEGSSSETVVLYDAGQPRRFEIARNELHFRDPTGAAWVQSVPAEPSVERLRARAASLRAATGAEVKLVIYPAGHPRDEFTRRLLTRRVLVRLTPQFEAASVLTAVSGVAQWQVVDYLP